jgi:hypothetical protein
MAVYAARGITAVGLRWQLFADTQIGALEAIGVVLEGHIEVSKICIGIRTVNMCQRMAPAEDVRQVLMCNRLVTLFLFYNNKHTVEINIIIE